jgi:hypothetical protein
MDDAKEWARGVVELTQGIVFQGNEDSQNIGSSIFEAARKNGDYYNKHVQPTVWSSPQCPLVVHFLLETWKERNMQNADLILSRTKNKVSSNNAMKLTLSNVFPWIRDDIMLGLETKLSGGIFLCCYQKGLLFL